MAPKFHPSEPRASAEESFKIDTDWMKISETVENIEEIENAGY